MSDGWFIASAIAVVVAGVVLLLGVVMVGVYYVDKSRCGSFGRQTGREVKFVKYNLVTWDCLTRTADGKWIPTRNLREFGEQP